MDVSCDSGFEVALTLPEDASTSFTVQRVNADSYGADDSTTGDPTTMDFHSVALDPDQAIQVANGMCSDLGIDSEPLRRWKLDVKTHPNDSVDSPFVRTKLGYLTAELQAPVPARVRQQLPPPRPHLGLTVQTRIPGVETRFPGVETPADQRRKGAGERRKGAGQRQAGETNSTRARVMLSGPPLSIAAFQSS